MPTETVTTPTLAELKKFICEIKKFRYFENWRRNEELMHKVIKWLKEKSDEK